MDIDTELVNDIYTKLDGDVWGFKTTADNNNILSRIHKNIKLFGNSLIEETDPNHSWVKIESSHVYDMKFINTKGFERYLKTKQEIEDYNKSLSVNSNFNFSLWKQTPIPWNNFLILKAYRCVSTKSIGFTYSIKNTYIIKPFNIIKHNWKLKDVLSYGSKYTCESCGLDGEKRKGMHSAEIFPINNFMLSCNEHAIKKLLE